MGDGSFDYYSFMCLNLLLRRPTYSSLYDLYVYKLNATDRDAWQHDKRDVDFFATDYGIKSIFTSISTFIVQMFNSLTTRGTRESQGSRERF